VGRFLSLHRSTVHMPYFLTGYLMRKHSCFFPYAESARAKAMTYVALAVNITAAVLAAYSWVRPWGSMNIIHQTSLHLMAWA